MTAPNRRPFADAVALWQPDPEQRALARRRLAAMDGVELFDAPAGWLVGIKCLPGTQVDDIYNADAGVLIPQGADLLGSSVPDWQAIARDLRETSGYCARTAASDFAAVALGEGGLLHAAYTHATLMPLLHSAWEDGLAWSSSLDLMAMARPEPPQADRAILATWCNAFPFLVDGRSILQGVGEYPRGSRLKAGPGQTPIVTRCDTEFLGPELANARLGPRECGEWLREMVLANLRRDLVTDGVNLLALSCGRDSSTIASLVHQHLGLPMTTVSTLPTDSQARARELAFAEPSLVGLPAERRLIIDWPDKSYQSDVLKKGPDVLQPTMHPLLCELNGIREHTPVDVYFGGEFCDELIGGESVLDEWLADVGLPHALWLGPIRSQRGHIYRRTFVRVGVPWLDRVSRRLRKQPNYYELSANFTPALREEVGCLVKRVEGSAGSASQRMLARYTYFLSTSVGMNWAASAAMGVRRAFPLLTREILMLLWSTRARHRLHPDTKMLFSEAFGSLVPEVAISRRDKGSWSHIIPGEQTVPSGIKDDLGLLSDPQERDSLRSGMIGVRLNLVHQTQVHLQHALKQYFDSGFITGEEWGDGAAN